MGKEVDLMNEQRIAVLTNAEKASEEIQRQLEHLQYGQVAYFTETTPFFTYVDEHPGIITILNYTGPYSVEIAMKLRDRSPSNPLIWFSDLDFGLVSYRIHTDWFGMMPVTEEVLKKALDRVQH